MISIKYKFVIVCEYESKGRACTCKKVIEAEVEEFSNEGFTLWSERQLEDDFGWNLSPQLCPEHNTKTNKKKKFKKAEKGSLADLMRNLDY